MLVEEMIVLEPVLEKAELTPVAEEAEVVVILDMVGRGSKRDESRASRRRGRKRRGGSLIVTCGTIHEHGINGREAQPPINA